MMKPSEILGELQKDHTHLRALIDDTRDAAERCAHGEDLREKLWAWIAGLMDAVRAHNRREEHLILEVLPTLAGWDEVRAQFLTHEHLREHNELYEALEHLRLAPDPKSAGEPALGLLTRLLMHMQHEEHLFVRPEVLKDGVEAPPPTRESKAVTPTKQ